MWNVLFPLSTRCQVISIRIHIRHDIFYMWNVLFPLSTRCYVISGRIHIRYDFYVCGMCFSHCQRTYAKGRFLLATRYETIYSSTYDYYTVRPAMYIGKPDFCIIKRDPIEVLSRSDRGPKEHTHPFSQLLASPG